MQLIACDDAQMVAAAVADRLLEQRRAALAATRQGSKGPTPLGLATGRTMEPVYAALAERWRALSAGERQTLQRDWLSFNLDEYVGLGPTDPSSFSAVMARQLVAPLGLDPSQVRLPDGRADDPHQEASRYGAELAAAGGVDLQLLGLGLNGHVGFNEPPCTAEAACRCEPLTLTTRQQNAADFGGDAVLVPAQAITLGLREIYAASSILLVVIGAAKAAVLQRLLHQPPSPELPASWLLGHRQLTLIADRAALTGGA
jgi:glucosamine-6-phosphate deaminase